MLTENKFSKYLLYAIGEIVLVVLGILIALAINNANEEEKNRITEKMYLKGILSNLRQDVVDLNQILSIDTLQLDAQTTILKAFDEKKIRNNIPLMIQSIATFERQVLLKSNDLIFSDMQSSGKTNLITNDSLRLLILDYYTDLNNYKLKEEKNIDAIIRLKEDIGLTKLDANSRYENADGMPEQWSYEINKLDLSFFEKDNNTDEVGDFASRISTIKVISLSNHRGKLSLLKKAETLIENISEYKGE